MPRLVADTRLDTRAARARLKPAGKPYWRALDHGLHLGYRKGLRAGRWVVRVYLGAQRYRVETLGTADDHTSADGEVILDWRQAQQRARERLAELHRQQSGPAEPAAPYTVAAALRDYLGWLETHRKSARGARYRAEALIEPELGAIELSKLTTKRIRDWFDKVARTPARVRSSAAGAQRHRKHDPDDPEAVRQRRASANRTFAILRAALNRAWRDGKVSSDAAWRRVQPFRAVDSARARYLTLAECARLRNACRCEFRHLVEAALLTGCRYGELGALNVADFHPDAGTVQVRASKSGRSRHVILTDEGVAFFTAITAGRHAAAPMLQRADGERWGKSHQGRPLLAACRGARIDPPCDFHALRHTYASLTIMAGVPIMVVARNLGHVDTRMCERHYGHLAASFVRDAIRAGVPTFGITVESGVTPLVR